MASAPTLRAAEIAGVGHYVPARVVKNAELEDDDRLPPMPGFRSAPAFRSGAGLRRARIPPPAWGPRPPAAPWPMAGLSADDVQLIVFATLSPDYFFPGSGVLHAARAGHDRTTCPALDVRNQCSGFIYGLSVADQFVRTGMYDTVLVVGSEIHSSGLDKTPRGRAVSVIFGDGAGRRWCCAPARRRATAS
ncbi:MAG: hypothetical protein WKG07_18195 [Hymenobacter sp.]